MCRYICYVQGPSYRRHVLPDKDVRCSNCQALMWLDERLSASPANLLDMLVDHTTTNADFHKYIRVYNTSFAFASMVNIKVDDPIPIRNDNNNDHSPNPAFCINGTIYHKLGSLRSPSTTERNSPMYTFVMRKISFWLGRP
ncbi:unnamed protein product [Absidia cylindrospora]